MTNKLLAVLLIILISGLVSGCGSFTPVFKKNNHNSGLSHNVKIQVYGDNSVGYTVFRLRNFLNNQLALAELPENLNINIKISEDFANVIYNNNATSLRSMGSLYANIIISKEHKVIGKRNVVSTTSFTQNEQNEFINRNAINAAKERLSNEINQKVFTTILQLVNNN